MIFVPFLAMPELRLGKPMSGFIFSNSRVLVYLLALTYMMKRSV